MKSHRFFYSILLLVLWTPSIMASQYTNKQVDALIASGHEPDGVVFELMAWGSDTWNWAAPMLNDLRNQLKARYPDIDIAVVSHGSEQFQLTKQAAAEQPQAVQTLTELTGDGVSLHVCGTHSEWNNISEDSYLDIVDVSPSGPAQINDYVKLGYKKIFLRKPR